MKVLLINKFLYPNGGSETYIFKLGEYLVSQGHEVQYFGMEHEGRIVGNRAEAYTSDMDFHGGSKLSKLTYPIKTIYSSEARKKLRIVLEDFEPDVCHLNNFNFQLTPSIILEIAKWRKQKNKECRIIYTAHDSQLVCPNHLMQVPLTGETCTKCLGGHFLNCTKNRCIHGSLPKSFIGTAEGCFWKMLKVYEKLDAIISPSNFLKEKLSSNPTLKEKITVLHNFVETEYSDIQYEKEDYILYYGRFSKEKGINTLLNVVDELPDFRFVFAGTGPLENEVEKRDNIENKGFLSGEELAQTIAKAKFTVIPSECFENCPFSVMESQMYGTPVIGADIGGIPELIENGKTGELFESGNSEGLKNIITALCSDTEKLQRYTENCKKKQFVSIEEYCEKLIKIYS